MKALPPSHELLRLVFKAKGCKAIAADLKYSRSLVEKWARARRDGRSEELNPLDRVVTLFLITGDVGSSTGSASRRAVSSWQIRR